MTDVPPPPPSNYGGAGTTRAAQPAVSYWKKVVLENYANFDGRARRAEFWWYFLANLIISIVFNIIDAVLGWGCGPGSGCSASSTASRCSSPDSPWACADCTTPTRAAGGCCSP